MMNDLAGGADWPPERITALRVGLGWTKARLSRAVGVSARTVLAWEAGTRNVGRVAGKMLGVIEANENPDDDDNDLSTLAGRLRALLKSRGLTIAEVARRAGMSRQQAHAIISGATVEPTPETLGRIVEAAGATLDDLESFVTCGPSRPR